MSNDALDLNNESALAMAEVSHAAISAEQLVSLTSSNDSGDASLTREVREQQMRERAKKERNSGVLNLQKRHSGVATHIKRIVINERVAGSAFERFFSVIENSLFIITRRGEMFVGKANLAKLMAAIEANIGQMEKSIQSDMAAIQLQLTGFTSNPDYIPVQYTPAAVHDVEFKTKLAMRVADLFIEQDKILMGMQTLLWNDALDQSKFDAQERKLKKDLRTLTQFFAKTLRGMNDQATKVVTAVNAELPVNETATELQAAA